MIITVKFLPFWQSVKVNETAILIYWSKQLFRPIKKAYLKIFYISFSTNLCIVIRYGKVYFKDKANRYLSDLYNFPPIFTWDSLSLGKYS